MGRSWPQVRGGLLPRLPDAAGALHGRRLTDLLRGSGRAPEAAVEGGLELVEAVPTPPEVLSEVPEVEHPERVVKARREGARDGVGAGFWGVTIGGPRGALSQAVAANCAELQDAEDQAECGNYYHLVFLDGARAAADVRDEWKRVVQSTVADLRVHIEAGRRHNDDALRRLVAFREVEAEARRAARFELVAKAPEQSRCSRCGSEGVFLCWSRGEFGTSDKITTPDGQRSAFRWAGGRSSLEGAFPCWSFGEVGVEFGVALPGGQRGAFRWAGDTCMPEYQNSDDFACTWCGSWQLAIAFMIDVQPQTTARHLEANGESGLGADGDLMEAPIPQQLPAAQLVPRRRVMHGVTDAIDHFERKVSAFRDDVQELEQLLTGTLNKQSGQVGSQSDPSKGGAAALATGAALGVAAVGAVVEEAPPAPQQASGRKRVARGQGAANDSKLARRLTGAAMDRSPRGLPSPQETAFASAAAGRGQASSRQDEAVRPVVIGCGWPAGPPPAILAAGLGTEMGDGMKLHDGMKPACAPSKPDAWPPLPCAAFAEQRARMQTCPAAPQAACRSSPSGRPAWAPPRLRTGVPAWRPRSVRLCTLDKQNKGSARAQLQRAGAHGGPRSTAAACRSIGKSIARALDRKFFRFSVGGLHDVAEIRGHRRTYVGAMPGKIIQALKITQVSNPVILIDEIDKLGRDYRGDPSSALLEVLDPAQNNTFRDMYLDAPVDLSRVLFVCTANILDTIPGPLLDRMEVITLAGYVYEEKVAIANQFLIPSTIKEHGISDELMELHPEAVRQLIRDYAREAGVRELRKLLEKIARKVALAVVRTEEGKRTCTIVGVDNLKKYVGQPPHTSDHLFPEGMPAGVVMGLAWTSLGGKTLFIEARGRLPLKDTGRKSEKPRLVDTGPADDGSARDDDAEDGKHKPPTGTGARITVTGKLGKVMGESSEIAATYARLFIREVDAPNNYLDQALMHMNMPEGATPKDGPSAGVAMTSALLSLALDKPVKPDMAMTGELTLTGKILRVGGIKEKAIAARRENVGTIVLPMSNQADYMEIKPHLRAGLTAHFVDHFDDIYSLAFGETGAPKLASSRGSEVVTVHTPLEEAAAPPAVHHEICECPRCCGVVVVACQPDGSAFVAIVVTVIGCHLYVCVSGHMTVVSVDIITSALPH
ncbi:unnamed protein product [Prorocentrum cordatum]|uniref:Lon proteolytic domain-containing protein n=1 Tax=Prorocentrum cordatum TaxID=2364126 RepID=A0ABN9TM32_9DINO|nr:unnamed protein product [Polarella glacialis]